MSEGTTKPNGGREMNVINGDDKKVKQKVDEFGIEVTAVTVQFSDRKIRNDEISDNGDTINRPGDFVLASNPKAKALNAQEIVEGNKGKAKDQDAKAKAKKKMAERKGKEEKEDQEK